MHRKPAFTELIGAPARRGFILASMLPLCIASAHAMELNFNDGEITGRFDNTISYGMAVRTQGADRNFAAETAGATNFYTELGARNVMTQANKNDGNLNFADAGDTVSSTVKLNSLLELTRGSFGAQVSGFAFYDMALDDVAGTHADPAKNFTNEVDAGDHFTGKRLPAAAEDYAVSDVRLSSAYIWNDFEIGSRTVNVRFGKQVLSWGEALFLQDGINQANPADLSALRLPGAEIKDALLPLTMLTVSTNLSESLSVEGFWEFDWRRSEADPVGTFYSTTDAFFGYGSEAVVVDFEGHVAENLAEVYNFYHRGTAYGTPMASRLSNNKLDDVNPKTDGQFGIAARYIAESLNNTEFGFYFLNYHARKPTAGAVLGEALGSQYDPATCQAAWTALAALGISPDMVAGQVDCSGTSRILGGVSTNPTYTSLSASGQASARKIVGGINTMHYIDSSEYFLQYEQNQQVYGLTFSSNIGETSLSGELAYRPDAEFLPEVGDNLIARNAVAAAVLANGGAINTSTSSIFGDHIGGGATLTAGQTVDVTANEDMLNLSLVAIHNFGPTWIMDGLTGVLELGGAWVNGLDPNKLYAAEGTLGIATSHCTSVDAAAGCPVAGPTYPVQVDSLGNPVYALREGDRSQYLSDLSWGYRLVVATEFNDVFAGVNLKPQVRFAHDVSGNSVVGGNFVEGRKSSTVAVDAEYADWTIGMGTNIFWGAGNRNQLKDRDNVYASIKYSF